MRRILAILAAILIVALVIAFDPLGAQTTETERAAAASVLRRIEELQARLDPIGTAARLASRGDARRDAVLARAGAVWDDGMRALSDHIGRNPEVGWKEVASVDTLTKVLRSMGFAVETGALGHVWARAGPGARRVRLLLLRSVPGRVLAAGRSRPARDS